MVRIPVTARRSASLDSLKPSDNLISRIIKTIAIHCAITQYYRVLLKLWTIHKMQVDRNY